MQSVIDDLLTSASFVPHGYCLLWRPDLVALHAVSDGAVALSYFAIPLVLAYFLRKRPDIAGTNKSIAWLFVAFIMACGITHLIGLVTLWWPIYGIQGIAKAGTAVVSATTVAAMIFALPQALRVPSVAQLEAANAELRRLRDELEKSAEDRARALAITSQRLEAGILNAPIMIAEQSADLTYEWVSRGSLGRGPGWALGKTDRDLLPDPPLETVVRSKQDVLDGKGPRAFEIDVEQDDGVHTYDVRVQAGRVTDGRVETVISVAVDITDRKLREDQIKLLMRELAHRVKNIFAVVRAITRQTYAFTSNREDFSIRLLERLESLARSHDLLIEPQAGGTTLSEVVSHQLEHLSDLVGTQIHTDGANVHLRADQSQTVGLAIHELATNAVKYGALSQPNGQVCITWTTTGGRVHLRWAESDGPPVHPPQRRGFGRTVLENMVPRALKGTVTMTFGDSGLVWELTFPLA